MLTFTDGEKFDTSGPLRKEKRKDGWYIIGEGKLIPVKDEVEADGYLKTSKIVSIIKKSPNPQKEFFNQLNKILK